MGLEARSIFMWSGERVLRDLSRTSLTPAFFSLLFVPSSQAWDNVIGQNTQFVRNTGMGAMGAAGVVGVVAAFTEFKKKD